MRRWFEVFPSVLRDREDGAGGGGSDTHRVDMGAPQEVGVDHEPPDDPKDKKTPAEIELETLREQSARDKRRADDAEEDARYWAARNRRTATDSDEEPPAPRTAPVAAAAPVQMTAEELVEGLNKEGVQALYKAGFLTQAQADEKLDALRAELTGFVVGQRADAEFNGRIAQEFPTIAQESAKVAKDPRYRSTDPLFLRTGQIYRDMIADDPKLEKSPGTILAAARAATVEVQARGNRETPAGNEPTRNRDGQFVSRREETPARRRDRIDRARPDRGADDEESRGTGGGDTFTDEQQEVMRRLDVKPDKFVAHRDAAVKQESRRGRR